MFTTRQNLKNFVVLKSKILMKKSNFKKHDFGGKIVFEKQVLKIFLHTKNHVLIHFTL